MCPAHDERPPRALSVLRAMVGIGVALYGIAFLWVVSTRLFSRMELDFFGGVVWEGIDRVRAGQPLYPAPGDGFLPLAYPPLYTFISAAVAKLIPIPFVAPRLVSIAASAGVIGLLWHRLRRDTGTIFYPVLAIGLFVASYGLCGGAHDIEHPAALTSLLVLATTVLLLGSTSRVATLATGFLLAAAALTRLSAVLLIASAPLALSLCGQKKRALVVLISSGALLLSALAALHLASAGQSTSYLVRLPLAQGWSADQMGRFFGQELPRLGVILFVGAGLLWLGRQAPARFQHQRIILTVQSLAILAMATLGRLAPDGSSVDLLPLATVLAFAAPLASSVSISDQVEGGAAIEQSSRWAQVLCALAVVQLGVYSYDATLLAASPERVAPARLSFDQILSRLERQGPVWVLSHAGLTRSAHPNLLPLESVMRANQGQMPAPLAEAMRAHRFAAIMVDDFATLPAAIGNALGKSYFVGEKLSLTPWVRTEVRSSPRWILYPRKDPLPPSTSESVLGELTSLEMLLAEFVQKLRGEDYPDLVVDSRLDATARSLARALQVSDPATADLVCRSFNDGELCRAFRRALLASRPKIEAEQLEQLRDLWRLKAQDHAALLVERRALLDQIDCLRSRAPAQPDPCGANVPQSADASEASKRVP